LYHKRPYVDGCLVDRLTGVKLYFGEPGRSSTFQKRLKVQLIKLTPSGMVVVQPDLATEEFWPVEHPRFTIEPSDRSPQLVNWRFKLQAKVDGGQYATKYSTKQWVNVLPLLVPTWTREYLKERGVCQLVADYCH